MNALLRKAGMAVALAATALTAAAPAEAQRWGGYRGGYHGYHGGYGYRGGNVAGAAILGGLVGLGVGAAIADSRRPYGYGGPGYYGAPGYYAGPGYGGYYAPHCWRQWRFDPYWGREVPVRVCG